MDTGNSVRLTPPGHLVARTARACRYSHWRTSPFRTEGCFGWTCSFGRRTSGRNDTVGALRTLNHWLLVGVVAVAGGDDVAAVVAAVVLA